MFDGMYYVYEVYLERSFSAAAKKLSVSQPALSAAVKKVEKDLGVTIFDRSTNPITLTPAGRICIASAEQMRALQHNMRNQLNDLSEVKSGSVIVARSQCAQGQVLLGTYAASRALVDIGAAAGVLLFLHGAARVVRVGVVAVLHVDIAVRVHGIIAVVHGGSAALAEQGFAGGQRQRRLRHRGQQHRGQHDQAE